MGGVCRVADADGGKRKLKVESLERICQLTVLPDQLFELVFRTVAITGRQRDHRLIGQRAHRRGLRSGQGVLEVGGRFAAIAALRCEQRHARMHEHEVVLRQASLVRVVVGPEARNESDDVLELHGAYPLRCVGHSATYRVAHLAADLVRTVTRERRSCRSAKGVPAMAGCASVRQEQLLAKHGVGDQGWGPSPWDRRCHRQPQRRRPVR